MRRLTRARIPVDESSVQVPSRTSRPPSIRTGSLTAARGQRIFRAAHDERLIAELADEVAEDLGQPLVVLDDQDPHRGPRPSTAPQKVGSGVSPTPKRSRTTPCTWRANARTSPARAPSWATIASVCRVESPTGPAL